MCVCVNKNHTVQLEPGARDSADGKMDLENPGFVKRQLMKVDMGIFYWIMSAFRAAVIAADFVLDLLFGVTIQHGSREGQSFHRLFS